MPRKLSLSLIRVNERIGLSGAIIMIIIIIFTMDEIIIFQIKIISGGFNYTFQTI